MHGLHFLGFNTPITSAIQGDFQPILVLISILIATTAAFAGLSHSDLARHSQQPGWRRAWHILGAFTLGAGVWGMHFTGMLAYQLPLAVHYHAGLTALSIVPAIVAGFITLHFINRAQTSGHTLILGGICMGLGIGAMHYLGMAAMQIEAQMLYRPGLFVLSILVAILLAMLALSIRYWLTPWLANPLARQGVSALVMGLAVSGMHYVAMVATIYLPGEAHGMPGYGFQSGPLALMAVLVTAFIVLVSAFSAVMVRRLNLLSEQAQQSEQARLQLATQLETITNRVPGVVYQFERNAEGGFRFPYASDAIRDIYGVTPEQVRDSADPVIAVIHPNDLPDVITSVERSAATLEPWHANYRVRFEDGRVRWLLGNAMPEALADGTVIWNGFIMDVTEQKETEQRAHYLAHYDHLTDLPNRPFLLDLLEQALKESRKTGALMALVQLDLDGFRRFNDAEGQNAGDQRLKQVARTLQPLLRHGDIAARLASDEFALLWTDLGQNHSTALHQLESRLAQLQLRVNQALASTHYASSASMGVYLIEQPDQVASEALKRASIALHQAKQQGINQIAYYDPSTQHALDQRLQLEAELRQALPNHQFMLYLQPQVNQAGLCIGAEALLRWQHPSRGIVGPDHFIQVAEETGLIIDIGQWVLEEGCRIIQQWQDCPHCRDWTLSVNVSAAQFRRSEFVDDVLKVIKQSGVPSNRLKLELTESMLLADLPLTLSHINALRSAGIRCSLDDFGTGYSSLSYLSTLPFDEVKIDKTFIQSDNKPDGQRDWYVVETIITLANKLNMDIVAEGVETRAQLDRLTAAQCFSYQGYLFGKPAPLAQFMEHWGANGSEPANAFLSG